MKITLDSNPDNAPGGCLIVTAEDGRDILFQQDWDWSAVATVFGWSVSDAEPEEPKDYINDWREYLEFDESSRKDFKDYEKRVGCEHTGTDGTVNCDMCGMVANEFICSARSWLDENDGAEAEDPGYFDNEQPNMLWQTGHPVS